MVAELKYVVQFKELGRYLARRGMTTCYSSNILEATLYDSEREAKTGILRREWRKLDKFSEVSEEEKKAFLDKYEIKKIKITYEEM